MIDISTSSRQKEEKKLCQFAIQEMAAAIVSLNQNHGLLKPSLALMDVSRSSRGFETRTQHPRSAFFGSPLWLTLTISSAFKSNASSRPPHVFRLAAAAFPSLPPNSPFKPTTKLYVSGLSFRTTEESLKNAFQKYGQLIEVNLVMDKIANRPRGCAFLRYETEEESKQAIAEMHGKFLDGRVIFVEVARPKSEILRGLEKNSEKN